MCYRELEFLSKDQVCGSEMTSGEGQGHYKPYADSLGICGNAQAEREIFATGFSPSEVLAFLCAGIHVSSLTQEGSRSVVRLGEFGLCRVREEEVCACGMWVLFLLW